MSRSESFTTWTVKGTFFSDARTEAVAAEFGELAAWLTVVTWNELYARPTRRIGRMTWFGMAKKRGYSREDAERLLGMLASAEIGYLLIDGEEIGSPEVDEISALRMVEREKWRNKKRKPETTPLSPALPSTFSGDSPGSSEGILGSSPRERPTPTPTPTPQILDLNNSHPELTTALAPPENADPELWDLTIGAFADPDDPQCQSDTRYVGAGRLPLNKYPDIWLTRLELYDVFKTYVDAGVPKTNLSAGFKLVQSKLLTYSAESRRVQSVSAYVWLNSFILTTVLDTLKKSTDLKRSQKYSEAAQ